MTKILGKKRAVAVALTTIFSLYSFAGGDMAEGRRLLESGNVSQARDHLRKVLDRDESNAQMSLLYARTLDAHCALKVYDSLASNESVDISVRAEAYRLMGDYAFTAGDMQKATEMYRKSSRFGEDLFLRHRWALSTLLDGDTAAAQQIWSDLSKEHRDRISKSAVLYLARLKLEGGDFTAAHNLLSQVATPDPESAIKMPLLASRLQCAQALSLTDEIAETGSLIEEDYLERRDEDFFIEGLSSDSVFAVQVGAFGVRENALGLKEQLGDISDEIVIVKTQTDDSVLYRVRVGTFFSRKEAQLFLENTLSQAGFTGRVVQK